MRRATSFQAALRWAATSRVMSSKVSTRPSGLWPIAQAQPPRFAAADHVDVLLDLSAGRRRPRSSRVLELRDQLAQRLAAPRVRQLQQRCGLAVHHRDAASRIEADHAGADAEQHGLDELAA